MQSFFELFNNSEDLIPVIAIGGGLLFAFSCVVISTISKTMRNSSHERTRREVAAYIAEGTMTTEQGERILKAGATSADDA